ncbi:unnamed protein product [Staurois parvus]|uniref:Uncharacterized protein n=1 Tax=Staurois parvus TaxID=386267 RepID=A0ABN9FIA0_9NEOB|nr:unnamed protein product [Staurois parvus]
MSKCRAYCNLAFLWHWCNKGFILTTRSCSSFLFMYRCIVPLTNNHFIFFQSSLYFS